MLKHCQFFCYWELELQVHVCQHNLNWQRLYQGVHTEKYGILQCVFLGSSHLQNLRCTTYIEIVHTYFYDRQGPHLLG